MQPTREPTDVAPDPTAATADASDRTTRHHSARAWIAVAIAAAGVLAVMVLATTVLRIRVVPAADSAEAGFARDMSTHHAQAVEMAELLRDRTDDATLRTLAADIATTQQAQIGRMRGWLDVWGVPAFSTDDPMVWMNDPDGDREMGEHGAMPGPAMPGMATPAQLARLRDASGRAAEILFLQLMIDHHRGGVAMADAVLGRTDHDEVRELATAMATAQRSEIDAMRDLLRARDEPVADDQTHEPISRGGP